LVNVLRKLLKLLSANGYCPSTKSFSADRNAKSAGVSADAGSAPARAPPSPAQSNRAAARQAARPAPSLDRPIIPRARIAALFNKAAGEATE
jgi:hypothetical protein